MSSAFISAAIDFGTTFSSWAFSFKHDFKREKTRVTTKKWKSPGSNISMKTPTCILIQPDGETPDSFGYDAEKKYSALTEQDEHKNWYFFQRFKMQLYTKNIDRNFQLKDISGKSLPAKTVFSLSIRILKQDLIATVSKAFVPSEKDTSTEDTDKGKLSVTDKDINWVITVPAIWNDAAKQFMREAAVEAEIPDGNIFIGLEPEVASVYCRFLPAVDCEGLLSCLKPGSTYMILDAGGGTVDITVHDIGDNGRLKEIHKASGGDWGGTRVDKEFHSFLGRLFGSSILQDIKVHCMEDYLQLMCDFEVKKRLTDPDIGRQVTIRIPSSFRDILQDNNGMTLKEAVECSEYKEKLGIMSDKLRIDYDLFRSFFDNPVEKIKQHVSQILEHPDVAGCRTILMVGGFSDSVILQRNMIGSFPSVNIVVPPEAELCVLKGAVIFGHDPSAIAERKLKCTYGTKIIHEKSESCKHPPSETIDVFGKPHCDNIFDVHVRVGQIVHLDEEQDEKAYRPVHPLASDLPVSIYSSTEENPTFVTDDSCTCIGTLKMKVTPDLFGALTGLRAGSGFGVTFMFGGTEVRVKGVDKISGKEVNITLNCLGDM